MRLASRLPAYRAWCTKQGQSDAPHLSFVRVGDPQKHVWPCVATSMCTIPTDPIRHPPPAITSTFIPQPHNTSGRRLHRFHPDLPRDRWPRGVRPPPQRRPDLPKQGRATAPGDPDGDTAETGYRGHGAFSGGYGESKHCLRQVHGQSPTPRLNLRCSNTHEPTRSSPCSKS